MISGKFLNFFQSKFNEILIDKCSKICYTMINLRIDAIRAAATVPQPQRQCVMFNA